MGERSEHENMATCAHAEERKLVAVAVRTPHSTRVEMHETPHFTPHTLHHTPQTPHKTPRARPPAARLKSASLLR